MWPWEHVLVGYLAYSLFCHLWWRESPGGLEAIAVVLGSLLPDLIDKPLAWEFGVFDGGYALGHSVLFVLPFTLAVGLFARVLGRVRAGVALAVGYVLHLPGDAFYGYLQSGTVHYDAHLWPVVRYSRATERPDLVGEITHFATEYWAQVQAGDQTTYVLAQFALAGVVFVLWLVDGAPVLRECLAAGKRLGGRFLAVMGKAT
ncbi:metal-dependent hydrolase [Halovivax limisalsi]|uniref:metal-dependent hydrolase n=1 Tax=Halovivax limisalsi TaxID=1453760 RepID=UPI001FFD01E0|nr:metal-dependent hydrolase [Halovivax limisalsi]